MKILYPFFILVILLLYLAIEYSIDSTDTELDMEVDILQGR